MYIYFIAYSSILRAARLRSKYYIYPKIPFDNGQDEEIAYLRTD